MVVTFAVGQWYLLTDKSFFQTKIAFSSNYSGQRPKKIYRRARISLSGTFVEQGIRFVDSRRHGRSYPVNSVTVSYVRTLYGAVDGK